MILLKGEGVTSDARLDRVVHYDPRSLDFLVRTLPAVTEKKPRSYTWAMGAPPLDQGREGACVGFGVTHELLARPAEIRDLDAAFAREKIYWPAQKIDPWEGGSYRGARPYYEGTAVLAGIKVAQLMGFFASYHWCKSLQDMILGIGYGGPAVCGFHWMSGMMDTDRLGFIRAIGRIEGGHCILINRVNVAERYFAGPNSWGTGWGQNGYFKLSFDDAEKLLINQGEVCIPQGRKVPR